MTNKNNKLKGSHHKLRRLAKNILFRVSGNQLSQKLLEKAVSLSQMLMGISSGSDVFASGEKSVLTLLIRDFAAPYTIIDAGCNKGQFIRLVLKTLREKEISLHAFEPAHETYKVLEKFFGEKKEIFLNKQAVGKETGHATLHYDAAGSAIASLTKRNLGHFGIRFDKSERVPVTTIDTYCSEMRIDHVHLLKLDVEGHEFDALIGSTRMLAEDRIDMLTFEFGGCNIDTRTYFRDFWYFFKEFGMNIIRITPSGFLVPIEEYMEIYEQFRTTNYLVRRIGT